MEPGFRQFIVDPISHYESDIDEGIVDGYIDAGGLKEIIVPIGTTCCTRCGRTFPDDGRACPNLILLAVQMLEVRGDNQEKLPNKKAHDFIMSKKEEVKTWWSEKTPRLTKKEAHAVQRTLIRIGVLTDPA